MRPTEAAQSMCVHNVAKDVYLGQVDLHEGETFMASLERISGSNKLLTKIKSCWPKSTLGGDGGCC